MLYDFFVKVAPVATVRVVRDTKTLESEHHGYLDLLMAIFSDGKSTTSS